MELKRKNFDAFTYKNEVPLVNHVVQPLLSKMIDQFKVVKQFAKSEAGI